ncbi:hypothetical protein JW796_04605 [Candidatus Dojkabacteria bacterium]|nr:hypothetical protein [Candidatus Dojkabacteria bacterium]
MTARKISYYISLIGRRISSTLRDIGISWQYISLIIVSLLLVIYLSTSIYGVIKRGKENYGLIAKEREKLNELEREGRELLDEVAYLQSDEFKENFARNNLNYVRGNQELYYVKREPPVQYEYLEKNLDPIVLDNYKEWWMILFLKS